MLVASADGVGTKLKLAALLGRFQGVGTDLVNHCVNDIFCAGAEPLFFLDYIASGSLSDDERAAHRGGRGGGLPRGGLRAPGGRDGRPAGRVRPGRLRPGGLHRGRGGAGRHHQTDAASIRAGDALLGLPSSGLHTNGYSLARKVLGVGLGGDAREERARLERHYPELGTSLGDALLAVHRCYYNEVRPVLGRLKGIAHITGGGLPGNLPRILPDGLGGPPAQRRVAGAAHLPPHPGAR